MKDFKHIEHRRKCCCCGAIAQLRRKRMHTRYYYCASCYHIVYQTPIAPQAKTELTSEDLMHALAHNAITGRSAAEILDRILKERTV